MRCGVLEPEAASCYGRMAPDLCVLGAQRTVEREDRMSVLFDTNEKWSRQ